MSQSIETGRGLDAFESSQGLTTIKADSPKRFEMLLKAGENGVETLWLKWNPIETDENGFGLYGTYESNAWKIRDGKDSTKDSQGWICGISAVKDTQNARTGISARGSTAASRTGKTAQRR